MIYLFITAVLLTGSICGAGLWLTHKMLRWQYIGLVQIALVGIYLIVVFTLAGWLMAE